MKESHSSKHGTIKVNVLTFIKHLLPLQNAFFSKSGGIFGVPLDHPFLSDLAI